VKYPCDFFISSRLLHDKKQELLWFVHFGSTQLQQQQQQQQLNLQILQLRNCAAGSKKIWDNNRRRRSP
jgi:hypothetical protein